MTHHIKLQDGTVVDAIDAYLDGLMTASQIVEFEKTLGQQEELRGELKRQQRIDESLAKQFAPPDGALTRAVIAQAAADTSDGGNGSGTFRLFARGFVVAAALAMAAVGVWRIADFYTADEGPSASGVIPAWSSETTLADAYRVAEKNEFKPHWVCKDDAEFSDVFAKSVNQPLLLAQSSGVVPLGLGYAHVITERTLMLLVRVDGRGVIVFVDKLNYDPGLTVPEDVDLRVFRRELGRAVLYEVTPLDGERVLDAFYDPSQK